MNNPTRFALESALQDAAEASSLLLDAILDDDCELDSDTAQRIIDAAEPLIRLVDDELKKLPAVAGGAVERGTNV